MRLACFIKSAHVTELLIPSRTNEWTISVPDWKKPAIVEKTGARHGSCRSLLVRPFHGRNESKSIMIHTHGGAFITNTADIFSVLAAILASKFGIPVILPDYRKAPEDKYASPLGSFRLEFISLISVAFSTLAGTRQDYRMSSICTSS